MPLKKLNATAVDSSVSQLFGMRNKIINGAMVIDQRNVGANTTATTGGFTLDRWEAYSSQSSKFVVARNIGAVTPPAGFTNYLGVSSSSAYSITSTDLFRISQAIEGFNIADLAWGTAAASPITISFWVRSSLTGTFGGGLQNSANSRAYPFTYTINASNTWEYKTIVVPGETSGVWLVDSGMGLRVQFGLGIGSTKIQPAGVWYSGDANGAPGAVSVVGTSGATWFITGVQVEKGSTASSFDYRPISTELQFCQRYFAKSFLQSTVPAANVGYTAGSLVYTTQTTNTQYLTGQVNLPVTMRTAPTLTTYNPFSTGSGWSASGAGSYTASAYAVSENSIVVRNDTLVSSAGSNMSLHWTAVSEI